MRGASAKLQRPPAVHNKTEREAIESRWSCKTRGANTGSTALVGEIPKLPVRDVGIHNAEDNALAPAASDGDVYWIASGEKYVDTSFRLRCKRDAPLVQ
jgi:hypothetical protein